MPFDPPQARPAEKQQDTQGDGRGRFGNRRSVGQHFKLKPVTRRIVQQFVNEAV